MKILHNNNNFYSEPCVNLVLEFIDKLDELPLKILLTAADTNSGIPSDRYMEALEDAASDSHKKEVINSAVLPAITKKRLILFLSGAAGQFFRKVQSYRTRSYLAEVLIMTMHKMSKGSRMCACVCVYVCVCVCVCIYWIQFVAVLVPIAIYCTYVLG